MATTYRLIGKGTTSNGVAHMTQKTTNNGSSWTDCNGYTGTGKGRLNLIASTDSTITSGSLQSEPFPLLDTIVYDDMETTTYENYYKFNNSANLSYSTDWAITGSKSLKWDYETNTGAYNYWGMQYLTTTSSGNFSITPLLGKSLRFKVDVKSSCDFVVAQNKGFYIGVYCQAPSLGSGWKTMGTVMVNSGEHTGNSAYYIDFNVPSDATNLWVRFNVAGSLENNTLYIDNWKLYPI